MKDIKLTERGKCAAARARKRMQENLEMNGGIRNIYPWYFDYLDAETQEKVKNNEFKSKLTLDEIIKKVNKGNVKNKRKKEKEEYEYE